MSALTAPSYGCCPNKKKKDVAVVGTVAAEKGGQIVAETGFVVVKSGANGGCDDRGEERKDEKLGLRLIVLQAINMASCHGIQVTWNHHQSRVSFMFHTSSP